MAYFKIKPKGDFPPRVIEADNAAAALRHVAEDTFEVSKALKQSELVPLLTGGAKVEKAGEKPAAPATGTGDES